MPKGNHWLRKTMQMESARTAAPVTSRTSSPVSNQPKKKIAEMFHKPAAPAGDIPIGDQWFDPPADVFGVSMPMEQPEPDSDAIVEMVFRELNNNYFKPLPVTFNQPLLQMIEAYRNIKAENFEKAQLEKELQICRSDVKEAEKKWAEDESLLMKEIKRLEIIIAKDDMPGLMKARQHSLIDRSRPKRSSRIESKDAMLPPPSPSYDMAALSQHFAGSESSFSSSGDELPDEADPSQGPPFDTTNKRKKKLAGKETIHPAIPHPLITRDQGTSTMGYKLTETYSAGATTSSATTDKVQTKQGPTPTQRRNLPHRENHHDRFSFLPGDDGATMSQLLPETVAHQTTNLSESSSDDESEFSKSPPSKIPVSTSLSSKASKRTAIRDGKNSSQSLRSAASVTPPASEKGKPIPPRSSGNSFGKVGGHRMRKQNTDDLKSAAAVAAEKAHKQGAGKKS